MENPQRPAGITPIGVLYVIGDSLYIIGGIVLFIGIPALANNNNIFHITPHSFAYELLSSTFGLSIAVGLAALGIGNVVASVGFLTGKKWSWKSNVVLAIISAAVDIIILFLQANTSSFISAIIGFSIDVVLLYYLYRHHVKSYFGKTSI